MTDSSLLADLYDATMPPVRDRPLKTMPKSLFAYVLRVSGKQQVRLCLLTVLIFPLTLVPLELQRRIVDDAVAGADFDVLMWLGGLYFAVVLVQASLKYLRNIYLNRVAEGVSRILRLRIAHPESFGTNPDEGTKQAIISSEAENVGGFVAESISFPLLQVGIVVSVASYMLIVQPIIAVIAIGFLVPSVFVVTLTQPILNRLSKRKITVARELGECVVNNGDEKADEQTDPDGLIERIYQLRLRFANIKHAAKELNNLIGHMGPLSILMVGGWLVIQGQGEVGTIVAFISGYERMTGPARELLNYYRRLSMMHVQYRLVQEAGQASET